SGLSAPSWPEEHVPPDIVVEPVTGPSLVAAVVGAPVVGSPVVDSAVVPDQPPVVGSVAGPKPAVAPVAAGPPPQARSPHSGSVAIAAGSGPHIRTVRGIPCSSGLAG